MYRFDHFNFNVLDLEKSLAFYKEALGLEPVKVNDHAMDSTRYFVKTKKICRVRREYSSILR